jgi:hypothetical protein
MRLPCNFLPAELCDHFMQRHPDDVQDGLTASERCQFTPRRQKQATLFLAQAECRSAEEVWRLQPRPGSSRSQAPVLWLGPAPSAAQSADVVPFGHGAPRAELPMGADGHLPRAAAAAEGGEPAEEMSDPAAEDSGSDNSNVSDWAALMASQQRLRRRQHLDREERAQRRSARHYQSEEGSELDDDEEGLEAEVLAHRARRSRDDTERATPAAARSEETTQSYNIWTQRVRRLRWQDYLPSAWIQKTDAYPIPYLPQVGDSIVWFRQGHQEYLEKANATGWFMKR